MPEDRFSSAEAHRSVRILFLGNFLSRSGRSRSVCEDLSDRLEAAGHGVARSSTAAHPLRRLLGMLAAIWACRQWADVAHVDVFSGRAFLLAEAASWCLRRVGIPYVLTLHGGGLPAFSQRHPNRVRRVLAMAAAVTAPSRYLRAELSVLRADILHIPNAIELAAYEYRPRRLLEPRIIWLRAFHTIYNPTMAPRALAAMRAQYPDATLTMVGRDMGDGSLAATQSMIRELHLEKQVEIRGAVPKEQVAEVLNAGDIFLNTPDVDNAPVSVVEAMAAGLCVVTTNVGGIPYLIQDRITGLLIERDDAEGAARAMGELVAYPGLAGTLSKQGREQAAMCDWSTVLDQWSTLFRTHARRSPGRSFRPG